MAPVSTRAARNGVLCSTPVNNLVYNADGRSVHTVLVDGRVVIENYKPTFVDEWELIQRLQTIGEEVLAKTGVSFPSKWPVV